MGSVTDTPVTLPKALAELDRALAESAALRAKLADVKAELDNVYVMMRVACEQSAKLAVEMEHGHNEREQLRDSVEATTLLIDELTQERADLRRRLEQMVSEAHDLRARALR